MKREGCIAGGDAGPQLRQWAVARFEGVPSDLCAKAEQAMRDVVGAIKRKVGGVSRGSILVLLLPEDEVGASAMHREEQLVPRQIKEFAAAHGFDYVVAVSAGLLRWEPELVQAVLAHEMGHIVLGHLDSRVLRFLTQYRLPSLALYSGYETAADEFAVRLGYGGALTEVLRRWKAPPRTLLGRIQRKLREKRLRRLSAG